MLAPDPRSAGSTPRQTGFGHVLCGIDAGRRDALAAVAAVGLLAPDGVLELVAIASDGGTGVGARAMLTAAHASRALAEASAIAHDAGAHVTTRIHRGVDPGAELCRLASGADLLVVGAPVLGRVSGIVTGRAATHVLHRSPRPVLLARHIPPGKTLHDVIVLAHDGSREAAAAARLTTQHAVRRGSRVFVLTPPEHDAVGHHLVAMAVADLQAATGTEPTVVDVVGRAEEAIRRLAEETEATLVVVGNRGRLGLRAVSSVSERIAHELPIPVLVARGEVE